MERTTPLVLDITAQANIKSDLPKHVPTSPNLKPHSPSAALIGRDKNLVQKRKDSARPPNLESILYPIQHLATSSDTTTQTRITMSKTDDQVLAAFTKHHTSAATSDLRRLLLYEQAQAAIAAGGNPLDFPGSKWDVKTRLAGLAPVSSTLNTV